MRRKGKKRVLVYSLFITFVFSLLGLLLLSAYFRANIVLTDNTIEQIEKGAYNYLIQNENNEDIMLLKAGKKDKIYIPFEEIENKGFISDIYNVSGVVEVKYDNDFIIKYNNKPKDYLTVIFHSNDDILDTYAKTIYCDNKDFLKCLKNVSWPKSTDENINIKGFTLNSNYQDLMVKYDESISDLLSNNDYKIKHNKLNIYAITSRKYTMTIDNTLIGLNNEEISCEALNWAENCNIKLPSYEDFDNLEFNTKNDNTGYKFFEDEKYTLSKDETIYTIPDINKKLVNTYSYSSNENGYKLLFILENSLNTSRFNNLENIKTSINEGINNLTSNNISYSLITINDNINELVNDANKREFKKGLKSISASGNYNQNIIDSLINEYIKDEIIIVVSSNDITSLNNIDNKVYYINTNEDNNLTKTNSYNYSPSEDNANITILKGIFESIFSDINKNNNYVSGTKETIQVVDNMVKIDTKNINNVVIKLKDNIIVPKDYLYYRNNATYFAIKSFIIDNKINVNEMDEMAIEYLK